MTTTLSILIPCAALLGWILGHSHAAAAHRQDSAEIAAREIALRAAKREADWMERRLVESVRREKALRGKEGVN